MNNIPPVRPKNHLELAKETWENLLRKWEKLMRNEYFHSVGFFIEILVGFVVAPFVIMGILLGIVKLIMIAFEYVSRLFSNLI